MAKSHFRFHENSFLQNSAKELWQKFANNYLFILGFFYDFAAFSLKTAKSTLSETFNPVSDIFHSRRNENEAVVFYIFFQSVLLK